MNNKRSEVEIRLKPEIKTNEQGMWFNDFKDLILKIIT